MALTPLPHSVYWTMGMPDLLGIMLSGGDNTLVPGGQALGDRPVAGAHHGRQVWTFNTGGILTDPDKDVPADYEWLCGCVLGDPSTNYCGVLQDVLASATRQALTTKESPDKLAGFYEVDPRNLHDIGRMIEEANLPTSASRFPDCGRAPPRATHGTEPTVRSRAATASS